MPFTVFIQIAETDRLNVAAQARFIGTAVLRPIQHLPAVAIEHIVFKVIGGALQMAAFGAQRIAVAAVGKFNHRRIQTDVESGCGEGGLVITILITDAAVDYLTQITANKEHGFLHFAEAIHILFKHASSIEDAIQSGISHDREQGKDGHGDQQFK